MARWVKNIGPEHSGTLGQQAEDLVNSVLDTLSNKYVAVTNLRLTDPYSKQLTELDTAVITPSGCLVVLEVKAGDLSVENGQLGRYYEGQWKDIHYQLDKQYHLLEDRLRLIPHGGRVPMHHYLVLPTGHLHSAATINPLPIRVIDSTALSSLPKKIEGIEALHKNDMNLAGLNAVENFLTGYAAYTRDVSAISNILRVQRTRASSGLSNWVPRIETAAPIIVIDAPAGSGKTRLALTLLTDGVQKDLKCMYLGFTKANIDAIKSLPLASKIHFIGTWHELCLDLLKPDVDIAGMTPSQRKEFFDELAQRGADEMIGINQSWDRIVIDGSEDFSDKWLEAIPCMLSDKGKAYLLADSNAYSRYQPPKFGSTEQIVIHYPLTSRCSIRQAEAMVSFGIVPEEFSTTSTYEGSKPSLIVCTPEEMMQKTGGVLQAALANGFSKDDIAIISWKGIEKSLLIKQSTLGGHTLKRPVPYKLGDDNRQVWTQGEILADTIHRFKGLSVNCVIVTEIDFDKIGPWEAGLLYQALTRASMATTLVMTKPAYKTLMKRKEGR